MSRRRVAIPAVLAIAATLALAGCSSSATPSAAGKTTATQAAGSTASSSTTSAAGGAGTTVMVEESEYNIGIASTTMTAGTYTFKVSNHGRIPHNLTVDGPGVQDKASPTMEPGDSGEVTVILAKGSYELYCSVDSHKDRGMDVKIQVS